MCDAQVEWENALNLCVAHPLKNHKSRNISVTYDLQLISYTSKFKTVPCLIAAKGCVSEVKLCFRNSQIPYLKVNSIFKKFFVYSGFCMNDTWDSSVCHPRLVPPHHSAVACLVINLFL